MPKGKIEVAPARGSQTHGKPIAGRASAWQRPLPNGQAAARGVPIRPTLIRPIEAELADVLCPQALSAPEAVAPETATLAKRPSGPSPDAEGAERSLEEWIDETLGELPGQLLRRARDRTTHDVSLAQPYLLGEPARDLLDRPRVVKRVRGGAQSARVLRAPAELLSIFGTLFSTARGIVNPNRTCRRPGRARAAALGLVMGASVACRSGDVTEPAPGAVPPVVAAAGAGAVGPRGVKASERERPKASAPWRIPVGPNLIITPGKGLGPIRFGARVETIERLIGEPCEEKREEAGSVICRYSAQAVDFVLQNGVVTEMRAHRLGRPFKPEPKLDYGIFNGRFAEGVAFGMLPAGARELLGAPKATRTISEANPNNTVEVYEYDGFSLEFDRTTPQTVVLGGVVLRAPKP